MAFTTTMLSWSVLEYWREMGNNELENAKEAIKWGTDYLMKATSKVSDGVVFVQVGDPNSDHTNWERPEDMTTDRTAYSVTTASPASEVPAEMAAALAASSLVFRKSDRDYPYQLLQRAILVFEFADKYRGSIKVCDAKDAMCPFYCSFNGYEDELLWGATWLFKATKNAYYWNYVNTNAKQIQGDVSEFGWDAKNVGINVLISNILLNQGSHDSSPFIDDANTFVCGVLPQSPSKSVSFSQGGLLFKEDDVNMQHVTGISFLVLTYAKSLDKSGKQIDCGSNSVVTSADLIKFVKSQVDYILGSNPMKMSYMVGYGKKYPQYIHHRGSSLPSLHNHPDSFSGDDAWQIFHSSTPNANQLTGALVGGPNINDEYTDTRLDSQHTEPTTYLNAPLVGVLAHFTQH
ncbi:unnamed protein product [Cuscuta europaea]|nr:unnamed protein product [Cuscuta europaea]